MINYYDKIKETLLKNEVYESVKDYSKERNKVLTYFEVGKLLSEAGKEYGKNIIGQYAEKLVNEVGKKYNRSTLFRMKQFYNIFSDTKVATSSQLLTWSHYVELLPLNDINKINYYIKLYIEDSKKDMNENESLNVHITLLKEVLSYLNEDYDIIFENRLKIELLLQEIFQNDSYVNIFINRLYSKDIKSINDFKNILYEQMQNDLQKSAILKENIKVYSNFYNSCKIFLLSSKRNAAVSKKVTEDIKQILILIK